MAFNQTPEELLRVAGQVKTGLDEQDGLHQQLIGPKLDFLRHEFRGAAANTAIAKVEEAGNTMKLAIQRGREVMDLTEKFAHQSADNGDDGVQKMTNVAIGPAS